MNGTISSMNLSFDLPLVTVDDYCDGHGLSNNCISETLNGWDKIPDLNGQQVDSGVDDENDEEEEIKCTTSEKVTLPARYYKFTRTTGVFSHILGTDGFNVTKQPNGRRGEDDDPDECYNTLESREKDLTTAMKWIRQEMDAMRKQNKSLLKQFNDLRVSIVQLRYSGGSAHGSLSDLSSVEGGSSTSLNENDRGAPMHLLSVGDEWRFGKAPAMKSVSLPCSPMITRARKTDKLVWGSLDNNDFDEDYNP